MTDILTDPDRLTRAIHAILLDGGCSAEEAEVVSTHLVEASLSGHDSHGVIRIMRYREWLRTGQINARKPLKTLLDTGTMIHLDGQDGMGQWLAREATALGIARAREHGTALIALRRAGHIGRLGAYAEQAAEAGMVSIQFCNVAGSRLVAPFGSAARCISTAPVAIGVPNGEGDPFILDFATSMVAEGKALVAGQGGKPLPEGALIGEDGKPTANPRALYGPSLDTAIPDPNEGPGALRAMGDHKGSGLALACELLAGALTGNGTNGPAGHSFGNGLVSILVDPARLDDGAGFAGEVAGYVDYVRASQPAAGVDQVLTPGDRERAMRAERRASGLPLPEPVFTAIAALAAALPQPIPADDLRMRP